MKIKIVTGFVPLPKHPRPAQEYHVLADRFNDLRYPLSKTICGVEDCWLWQFAQNIPGLTHSIHDNPNKNTMAYHAVLHQKFEWLVRAACLDDAIDTFVYIDYGIFHLKDITVPIIEALLDTVRVANYKEVSIPGCWSDQQMTGARVAIPDSEPCWRFCGGVVVVPRPMVFPLYNAVRQNAENHILKTRNVSWEVNTLARVEKAHALPVRWYAADHNKTMFTGF